MLRVRETLCPFPPVTRNRFCPHFIANGKKLNAKICFCIPFVIPQILLIYRPGPACPGDPWRCFTKETLSWESVGSWGGQGALVKGEQHLNTVIAPLAVWRDIRGVVRGRV